MPETEHKILACAFTFAKELTEAGQFEGHAAVFGNIDLQGDRIKRGAFKETIEESGGRWPVLFGHNTGRVVGFSTGAEEDTKGLRVAGEFTLASDEGRNAYATAKHAAQLGQKFGLSIGYGVRKDGADYDEESGRAYAQEPDGLRVLARRHSGESARADREREGGRRVD